MSRLSRDQVRVLRAAEATGLYEGAFPLFTGLSEQRCRVVTRQLCDRGLMRRQMTSEGVRSGTILVTGPGRNALDAWARANYDPHRGQRA